MKDKNKKLSLGLIYKNKENKSFFEKDLELYENLFQNIYILNLTDETLDLEKDNISIINSSKKDNFFDYISEFFNKNKLKSDYLLLLEDNEKIEFNNENQNSFLKTLDKNKHFNIHIKPLYQEVFEYEEEAFTTKELRLISLKLQNSKDFLDKKDIYYQEEFETIYSEAIAIKKYNIDSDFEIFKSDSFIDENNFQKKYLYQGNAYFHKESSLAEKYYYKVLDFDNEESNNQYKDIALPLLLKLLNRRLEFDNVILLSENYKNDHFENPMFWLYFALACQKSNQLRKAISYYNKSCKLMENVTYIYNNSDRTWKILSYIGESFFNLKRYKFSEKFYLLADEKLLYKKSPEIYHKLTKIYFYREEYEKAFEYYVKLFDLEDIPNKLLVEAKYSFLNLLLFMDFKEESLKILIKDIFDKPDYMLRIADTFYLNFEFEQALQIYLLIVQKFGSTKEILFKLGYICSRLRLIEQGCKYFEEFLKEEPDNLDALNNLGFLYLNQDKIEKSEKIYLKILKLNSFSFEANLYLAMIYLTLRIREKALKYLDQAKTLNPVSQEVIKLYQLINQEFNIK